MLKYLVNSKYIFIISIVLAFVLPGLSADIKPWLVPVLVIMMTFSIKDVAFHHVKKHQINNIMKLILLNYVFLTGLYILVTFLFVRDAFFRQGLFLLGIMPPAIGIISLSYILHSDVELAFITEFIGYAAGIFLIPVISFFLFGQSVSTLKMLEVLFYVIVVPFLLSRILHLFESRVTKLDKDLSKVIINLCYGISFYIIIGINRSVFFDSFTKLIPVFVVLIFMKFGIGSFIYLYLKKRIKKRMDILYVLFGTFKNGGAATAIAILLFGTGATVPMAVNGILVPLYILYLEWFILEEMK